MRRLLTWLLVSFGIAAVVRRLKRRRYDSETTTLPARESDPADELRQKIAESREEEPIEAPPTTDTTVEERRADVHDEGRAALDEMREADESS